MLLLPTVERIQAGVVGLHQPALMPLESWLAVRDVVCVLPCAVWRVHICVVMCLVYAGEMCVARTCGCFLAVVGGLCAVFGPLTMAALGILWVIPTGPFDTRNLAGGICLIVFAGVAGAVAACLSVGAGAGCFAVAEAADSHDMEMQQGKQPRQQ